MLVGKGKAGEGFAPLLLRAWVRRPSKAWGRSPDMWASRPRSVWAWAHRRIVVVGTSGSGKTTFAKRISTRLGVPHVELDSLNWEADWMEAPLEVFRERVRAALGGDAWVVDGNYSRVRDIVWSRADTIVWLDYPLWLVMLRLLRRTLRRVIFREVLWSNNRESIRRAFFSRDSILLWALTTYYRRRREYPALLADPEHAHLSVVRPGTPWQAWRWLEHLSRSDADDPG